MIYNVIYLYKYRYKLETIYFTNSSFTYVYNHQMSKEVTNVSSRYFNITTDIVDLLNNLLTVTQLILSFI